MATEARVHRVCVWDPRSSGRAVELIAGCPRVLGFMMPARRGQCDPPSCLLNASSLCSKQLACLQRECLVTRFQMEPAHATPDAARSRLLAKLKNKRVLILGDSMACQSFNTLVNLLRRTEEASTCERIVIEPMFGDRYVQATGSDGRRIDHYGQRGVVVGMDALAPQLPGWAHEANALMGFRTGGFRSLTLKWTGVTRIDFDMLSCYGQSDLNTLITAISGGAYDVVVLYAPAYHPLSNSCSSPASANSSHLLSQLERGLPNDFSLFWQKAAAAAANAPLPPRVVVLNAPADHIREWREDAIPLTHVQMAMNAHLTTSFSQPWGALRDTGWAHVDWDAYTRSTKPQNRAGGDWHYSCGLLMAGDRRMWSYRLPPPHIKVGVRGIGDCEEDGNTNLWRQLLLPLL